MNLPLFATGRVSSTKERIPFELVYYEASLKEQGALAREKYLKSGMGQRYSKNSEAVLISNGAG
jgi:putative endonuclease